MQLNHLSFLLFFLLHQYFRSSSHGPLGLSQPRMPANQRKLLTDCPRLTFPAAADGAYFSDDVYNIFIVHTTERPSLVSASQAALGVENSSQQRSVPVPRLALILQLQLTPCLQPFTLVDQLDNSERLSFKFHLEDCVQLSRDRLNFNLKRCVHDWQN